MLEEEFVGRRSWFIGLTDFGHEGRQQKYKVSVRQCGKFDKYLGGSGITPLKMQSLKVGPLGIPGVTTVMMTALF